jgi:cobalamin biosynthesis protein CobT
MSKVATTSANSAATHRSEDATGEPTSKRKASSRTQKGKIIIYCCLHMIERSSRKNSPEAAKQRGQSKRRKKKVNAKKDETANDKCKRYNLFMLKMLASVMEEDTDDQLVVLENEENEDEEQTDSDDSTTDSDTDTDTDDEESNTNQNTNQDDDDSEDDEDEVCFTVNMSCNIVRLWMMTFMREEGEVC